MAAAGRAAECGARVLLLERGPTPGRKLLLRGNHDSWWTSRAKVRRALPGGCDVLQNDAHLIDDRVVVLGGATGRDGIRGATFSSATMNATTGEVAGASVQIGDPITQRNMYEFLMEARDLGLYRAITDNRAGGLSSSICEMATLFGGVDLASGPDGQGPTIAFNDLWRGSPVV